MTNQGKVIFLKLLDQYRSTSEIFQIVSSTLVLCSENPSRVPSHPYMNKRIYSFKKQRQIQWNILVYNFKPITCVSPYAWELHSHDLKVLLFHSFTHYRFFTCTLYQALHFVNYWDTSMPLYKDVLVVPNDANIAQGQLQLKTFFTLLFLLYLFVYNTCLITLF